MNVILMVLFVLIAVVAAVLLFTGVVVDRPRPLFRRVSQRRGVRLVSRRVFRSVVRLPLERVSRGPSRRALRTAVHAVRMGRRISLPGWLVELASQQREVQILLGQLERAEQEANLDARRIVRRASSPVRLSERLDEGRCRGRLDSIRADLGLRVERAGRAVATKRHRSNRAANRAAFLSSFSGAMQCLPQERHPSWAALQMARRHRRWACLAKAEKFAEARDRVVLPEIPRTNQPGGTDDRLPPAAVRRSIERTILRLGKAWVGGEYGEHLSVVSTPSPRLNRGRARLSTTPHPAWVEGSLVLQATSVEVVR